MFKKDAVKTFGKLPFLVWLFGKRKVTKSVDDEWAIHSIHYKDAYYIIKSEPIEPPVNNIEA